MKDTYDRINEIVENLDPESKIGEIICKTTEAIEAIGKDIEELEKKKQLLTELDGLPTADELRKMIGISVMPCLVRILKSMSLKGFSSTDFVIKETGSLYHDGMLIGCVADVQKKLEHLGYTVYIKSDPRTDYCHTLNVSW